MHSKAPAQRLTPRPDQPSEFSVTVYKNLSVQLTWPGGQIHNCWEAWSEVQLWRSLLPTADVAVDCTSKCTHPHTAGQHTRVCLPIMIRGAQKGVFLSFTIMCIFHSAVKHTPTFSYGTIEKLRISSSNGNVSALLPIPCFFPPCLTHWVLRHVLPCARPETGNVNQKKAALDLQGGIWILFPLFEM